MTSKSGDKLNSQSATDATDGKLQAGGNSMLHSHTTTTMKDRTRVLLLFVSVTFGMTLPLMPLVVTQYMKESRNEVHEIHVGGFFLVYHVANLLTSLYVMNHVKKWQCQSQPAYLIGLLVQSISLFAFGLISLIESDALFTFTAYLQRILEAVAGSLTNGCAQAMLANFSPSRNQRVISWYDGMFALGTFLGPFTANFLYKETSLLAAYLFMGSLQLVLCGVILLVSGCSWQRDDSSDVEATVSQSGSCSSKGSQIGPPKLLHSPALWVLMLPILGTNMAVSLVDIGMGSFLSNLRLHWAAEAAPFFCANVSFFVGLSAMIACSLSIEVMKHVMIISMFLSASGCALVGYSAAYWSCCIGMSLIGGGFAMALVSVAISTIGIGIQKGMTETEARTWAPNIVDTASVLSKLPCYIVASFLIHKHHYPKCSVVFASCVFMMTLSFLCSYLPPVNSWIYRTEPKRVAPTGDQQQVDNAYSVEFK